MPSILSTTALVALLSTVQAAPGVVPDSKSALAAWAAAHGLGFDPFYVHLPSPSDVFNPPKVDPASLPSTDKNVTSLASHPGSLPSSPLIDSILPRYVGNDTRYQYSNPTTFPYRTVGRIQWSSGVICSGSLIGPRHVLTVKHCVPQDDQNVTLAFYPSYDRGANKNYGKGQVIHSVIDTSPLPSGDSCDTRNDTSIMILDRRLGDTLGYFGFEAATKEGFNQEIFTTMGYPGDKDNAARPYREDNIDLKSPGKFKQQFSCDKKTGPIWAEGVDAAGGQSGSSLWRGNSTIWGVLSVSVYFGGNDVATGFASGNGTVGLIAKARAGYP